MAGSSPWNNIDSVHPGIHIKTVYKHDQTNDDQTIINQRLRPVCKATAKNPRKYNKQDPKKPIPKIVNKAMTNVFSFMTRETLFQFHFSTA